MDQAAVIVSDLDAAAVGCVRYILNQQEVNISIGSDVVSDILNIAGLDSSLGPKTA